MGWTIAMRSEILNERFRARAHDVDAIIKAEQVHIGAGVMSAQHPVNIK